MVKKIQKLFISLLIVLGTFLVSVPAQTQTVNAASVTASGTRAAGGTWSLDSDGVLTLSGAIGYNEGSFYTWTVPAEIDFNSGTSNGNKITVEDSVTAKDVVLENGDKLYIGTADDNAFAVSNGSQTLPVTVKKDGTNLGNSSDIMEVDEDTSSVSQTLSYELDTSGITYAGQYTGTVKYVAKLVEQKTNLSSYSISVDDTVYNGLEQKMPVTATDSEGNILTENTDYTLEYTNCKDAGTATVTVTGIGKYTGTATANYTIKKATLKATTLSAKKMYDGDPLTAGGVLEGLVNNETATFVVNGTQTETASSKNTYEITWDGTAKESNYEVDKYLGILEVVAANTNPMNPTPVVVYNQEYFTDSGLILTAEVTNGDDATGLSGFVEGSEVKVKLTAYNRGDADYTSITANSTSAMVNDTPLTSDTLKAGEESNADYSCSVTSAENFDLSFTVEVKDKDGNTHTEEITITIPVSDSLPILPGGPSTPVDPSDGGGTPSVPSGATDPVAPTA